MAVSEILTPIPSGVLRELAVVGFSPCELWGLDEVSVLFTAWVEAGEVSSTSSVACVAVSVYYYNVRGSSVRGSDSTFFMNEYV